MDGGTTDTHGDTTVGLLDEWAGQAAGSPAASPCVVSVS
jgi:hypothetical protein